MEKPIIPAMAFYHQDGLPAAWKQGIRFAGKGGRFATMPDIVAARLATKPGDLPWETYFTTLTAEYCGWSKSGKLILIVAHGIGPMSTLEGILKAYSWEYNDRRNKDGGRITQQEFWDLEAGKFGEVAIIDLENYLQRYEYPFLQTLRSSEAKTDPVFKARFGPQTEQYIEAHVAFARAWHWEQKDIVPENKCKSSTYAEFVERRSFQHQCDGRKNSDPYIVTLGDAVSSYKYHPIEAGYALAHLISTGRLSHLHHEGNESLVLDVNCHEWSNGVRLVAIQAGGNPGLGIDKGPDARNLLHKCWRHLLVPTEKQKILGFRGLVKIGIQWFTQYPKLGSRLDTWEPEFVVTSRKKIGKPVMFRTEVGGYHGFFKFAVNEVKAVAPPDANAYFFISQPHNEWNGGNPTHQTCRVQFYRIKADTSKRLMRADSLANDYDTMMRLLTKDVA